MEDVEDFFWKKPTEYHSYHHMKINGYVDLTCCIITLVSNTFVIMVLTKKSIKSPINLIFTHIAIVESAAILGYAPRAWHEYFRVEICAIPRHRTYFWERLSLNCYIAGATFRHISVWMGVMLAVWRYIAVIYPLKERDWCNMRNTRNWLVAGYITIGILVIPPAFCITVGPAVKLLDQNGCSTTNFTIGQNITIYEFQVPLENNILLFKIMFFLYGFFIKLLPSVVMSYISFKLIVSLYKVGEHRKEMVTTSKRHNTYNYKMKRRISQQTDRITKLLLVILLLFIMGEVPHGIYAMFSVYYGPKFFWKYYYYAMEVFNSLTHVSVSFNFVIYYSMNFQFRKTFKELFNGNAKNSTLNSQRSSSSLPGVDKSQENSNRSSSITTISSTCT